jgi:PAS domain S-box-containing protein
MLKVNRIKELFDYNSAFYIVLITAIIVTIGIFLYSNDNFLKNYSGQFLFQASIRQDVIIDKLDELSTQVDTLKAFYEGSEFVTRDEFKNFCGSFITRKGVQSLGWAPRVGFEDADAFRRSAAADGLEHFDIFELSGSGEHIKAGKRSFYFPLFYAAPAEKNKKALGFDLVSEKTRLHAILNTLKDNSTQVSDSVTLVTDEREILAFILFKPVYGGDRRFIKGPQTLQQVKGFVTGTFRINDSIDSIIEPYKWIGLSMEILDMDASAGKKVIYRTNGFTDAGIFCSHLTEWFYPCGLESVKDFNFGGRSWRIRIIPDMSYAAKHFRPYHLLILPFGLTLSFLFAFYVRSILFSRNKAENLVSKVIGDLELSEDKFRFLFDTMSQGVVFQDDNGRIIQANRAAATILGISMDRLVGRTLEGLDLKAIRESGAELKVEEYPPNIAMRNSIQVNNFLMGIYIPKERSYRWLLTSSVPKFGKDASVPYMTISTFTDITGRVQAEKIIKTKDELINMTGEMAKVGGWEINAGTGVVTWTDEVARIHDVGLDEKITLQKGIDFYAPGSREKIDKAVKDVLQSGKPYDLELDIISAKGIIKHIRTTGLPVEQNGRVIKVRGIFQDITEQKRIEDRMRASENQYRSLFASIGQGVALCEMIFDQNGLPSDYRIIDVNEAYVNITGLTRERIIGKTACEFLPKVEESWIQTFGKLVKTGVPQYFENKAESLDKFYSVYSYVIKGNQFVVLLTDISERKNQEQDKEKMISELAHKNAELERFVYTVSHDLRNPLITIRGFTGVIKKSIAENDIEEMTEGINYIDRASASMSDILNDLLAMSRVGRLINPPVRVLFFDIVKEAANLVRGEAEAFDVNIKYSGLDDVLQPGAYVYGDRRRLVEVLQNLLANSIKFTAGSKPPVIEVGIRRDENPVYYVKDNGIGIEPQYLNKIFDLFEKLNPEIEGTGAGLAIVKRIIELHNGRIWAESEGIGKGSVFCFTLNTDKTESGRMHHAG